MNPAGSGLSSLIRTAAMEDPSIVWGIRRVDSLSADLGTHTSEASAAAGDAYGSSLSSCTMHHPRWAPPRYEVL